MVTAENLRAPETSRRRLIVKMAIFAGGASVLGASFAPRPAAAGALFPQADIGYQNRPKGAQRCELCAQWRPPRSCEVVAGATSATGWCGLFARKP